MKKQGRIFQCEPCREIIIFFAVSNASPFIAASTVRVGDPGTATAVWQRRAAFGDVDRELVAADSVVVVTTRCGCDNQISEEIMYKLAVAILLLSTPAFAQNKSEYQPPMPPNNMQKTVIPKSGGEQTPATTPTTAAEVDRPDATATRPAKTGPEQTSVPNAVPPVTATRTTGESNQSPVVKKMNEDEAKKIETEGK
jgi:hypothetical protein